MRHYYSKRALLLGILSYNSLLITGDEVNATPDVPEEVTGFRTTINPAIQLMGKKERWDYEKEQIDYWTRIVPTDQCKYENCCRMDGNETCAFEDLDRKSGKSTFIYPHKDLQPTKCLDANHPYSFQVYPRDSDKVIFFFQGGGSCPTERYTNEKSQCRQKTENLGGHDGVFARDNIENPYLNHTIVHVRYCSGDWHVGNAQMDYNRTAREAGDIKTAPAEHRGARNARVVLNWLKEDPTLQTNPLKELLIMGCSAGALGTQVWANDVLSEIKAERKAVIVDSMIGIFHDAETEKHFFQSEGVCASGLLNWHPKMQQQCMDGTLAFESILEETMKAHPETTFTMINPKKDPMQSMAYTSFRIHREGIKPIRFSPLLRKMYARTSRYSSQPNFASYWINGWGHCYLNTQLLFRSTVHGTYGFHNLFRNLFRIKKLRPTSLLSWVKQLPLKKGETIYSQCSGKAVDIMNPRNHWWTINNACDPVEMESNSTQLY